jgi:hypothetical protein
MAGSSPAMTMILGFRARRALAGRSAAIDIGGGGDETSRRKNHWKP